MADPPGGAVDTYAITLRPTLKDVGEAFVALALIGAAAALLDVLFSVMDGGHVPMARMDAPDAHGKGAALIGLLIVVFALLPLGGKLFMIWCGAGVGACHVLLRLLRSLDGRVDYVLDPAGITDIGVLHSRRLAWADLVSLRTDVRDGMFGPTVSIAFLARPGIKPSTVRIPISSTSGTVREVLSIVRSFAPSLPIEGPVGFSGESGRGQERARRGALGARSTAENNDHA
jgi:hypothetical protein